MAEQDHIEELIKEIAAKHGIAVARDDPILVLQTINYRLLADTAKAQQAQLDAYKEEMEALSNRWSIDTREKSERILNASLAAGKQVMGETLQRGAETVANAVQERIDNMIRPLVTAQRNIRHVAIFNIFSALATLIASLLIAWSLIH